MADRTSTAGKNADEDQLLASITGDLAWEIVQDFSTINRESGSRGEQEAADLIVETLEQKGVPVTVLRPTLLLSVPRRASVTVGGREFHAKTPAFSVSTGESGSAGRLVYLPGAFAQGHDDLFDSGFSSQAPEVAGTVVITEGLPLPQKVLDVESLGARAAIFVNPGERIHEAICTPVWGGPDWQNKDRQPQIPVLAVNRKDGETLIGIAKDQPGSPVEVVTVLEKGLFDCPLPVVEIPAEGAEAADFVLLHGHLDSWHFGVGDNAVGNGAMVELAVRFWERRSQLRRGIRLAWWPGHSPGRYAGSTWYADMFGVELAERCVAQVNCDSPGCRWATAFSGMSWTPEMAAFTKEVIHDVTGLTASGERPPRAGDWSFNNLGVSGTLMLSSTMPEDVRQVKGYYGVGGCGGNIEWHTEADTLEIADRQLLQRDMQVYGAVVWRLAADPVLPMDFRAAAADMQKAVRGYQEAVGERFDLRPVLTVLDELASSLGQLYGAMEELPTQKVNGTLKRLSRLLVRLHFAADEQFRQDPALQVPPMPMLAWAETVAALSPESMDSFYAVNSLMRGRNRAVFELREASRVIDDLLKNDA